MKPILIALACLIAATVLAVIVVFVLALATGPSIAAGERAALAAAVVNVLLWLAAIITFWFLSSSVQLLPRILGTLALAALQAIALAVVFLFTLVLLNR